MSSETSGAALRAGSAKVEITPWSAVQVAGDIGNRRSAQSVLDPLYARALVVSDGRRKICLVSADLTIITKGCSDRIRQGAARLGFEPDAVMVHVTQSHSAPALGHFMLDDEMGGFDAGDTWLRGGDDAYHDFAVARIVEAIGQADRKLVPVRLASGRAIEEHLSYNRRGHARDGQTYMYSGGINTEVVRLEGPIDPEVGVVALRGEDLSLVALLCHWTCHPVCVFPRPVVSADWPGAWCGELEERLGGRCFPMVINGCCGNLNPWSPFDTERHDSQYVIGAALAEKTMKVVTGLRFAPAGVVDYATIHVKLGIRSPDPQRLEEAKRFLAENPRVVWTDESHTSADRRWFFAANLVSVELQRQREGGYLDYEIQVLRIGDTAIVGLPGEPFVEGQLAIKLASPARRTLVAHCVQQYVGYLPVREAFAHGGHEVNLSTWAKVEAGSLEAASDAAIRLLGQIFGKQET